MSDKTTPPRRNQTAPSSAFAQMASLVGISGLLVLIDVSRTNGLVDIRFYVLRQSLAGASLCMGLILLAVCVDSRCWYRRLLENSILRYIGYSFYLVHPYAVFISRIGIEHFLGIPYLNVHEFWRLVIAFLLTMAFASFTYAYIERPFLRRPDVVSHV